MGQIRQENEKQVDVKPLDRTDRTVQEENITSSTELSIKQDCGDSSEKQEKEAVIQNKQSRVQANFFEEASDSNDYKSTTDIKNRKQVYKDKPCLGKRSVTPDKKMIKKLIKKPEKRNFKAQRKK